MIFGIIAASILAVFIGMSVHSQDMKIVHKQKQKTQILQREVKQFKKSKKEHIDTFHGDELANLGGKDVG